MQWFYFQDGTQLGPVDQDTLIGMIRDGKLRPKDLVRREETTEWSRITEVRELAQPKPVMRVPGLGGVTGGKPLPIKHRTPKLISGQADSAEKNETTPTPQASISGPRAKFTPEPSTYLFQAILVTVFCCLPLGLPAIIFAAISETYILKGDLNTAAKAADQARTWCWRSLIGGAALWSCYVFLKMMDAI